MFPDGRLVNADDALFYAPTVLTDDPAVVFGDWPEGELTDPSTATADDVA